MDQRVEIIEQLCDFFAARIDGDFTEVFARNLVEARVVERHALVREDLALVINEFRRRGLTDEDSADLPMERIL